MTTKPEPWTPPKPLPLPIETPRFVIREYTHKDAQQLCDAIGSSKDAMTPWLPWIDTDNRTVAECHYTVERFIREHSKPDCTDFVVGVFERGSGELVAGTGIHRIRGELHEGEIGYWVRADRHRTGVCTEAVRHMISSAFTAKPDGWGLRRLVMFVSASNTASVGVPEKIGLRREVNSREHMWVDGIGWDGWLGWGVLASEWDCETHEMITRA